MKYCNAVSKYENNQAKNDTVRIVKGVPVGEESPASFRFVEKFDVMSPMRDGVLLAMDLLLPEAPGPFPVILSRTPYDKTGTRKAPTVEDFARRGYAVAIQDVRGRFNSDGNFNPYHQEHNDGFDTVEWIAKQEWCDGNVGMIGGSYEAQCQWFAASQAPEALKAIVPTCSPPGNPFMNEPFYGGTMVMALAEWMVAMGRRTYHVPGLAGILSQHKDYFEALPLSELASMSGTNISWWEQDWLEHPTCDAFWKSCGYENLWNQMTVPALNITGWWDMNFLGAPRNFIGMRSHASTLDAVEGQRLVIGPWPHLVNRSSTLSGIDFGPDAITPIDSYSLLFFDRWLKGKIDNELDNAAKVHVFVVGANQWWAANSWPLPGTKQTPLYLHSKGCANSHYGDGVLSFQKPGLEPDDSFDADPMDPVRFPWSLHEGPVDDCSVAAREDVLCYTSEILTEAMDIVGDISAVLYASSSAKDCDWHIRLVDVHPDGTARFMCHGALRARFRNGFDKNEQLSPNKITRFDIDMTATGIRFFPGHKIRIEIASSWFNRFDRNLQTGAENWMRDEGEPVIATQTIFHDTEHPSHIILPIIPAGSVEF